jgi:hypothetical protein
LTQLSPSLVRLAQEDNARLKQEGKPGTREGIHKPEMMKVRGNELLISPRDRTSHALSRGEIGRQGMHRGVSRVLETPLGSLVGATAVCTVWHGLWLCAGMWHCTGQCQLSAHTSPALACAALLTLPLAARRTGPPLRACKSCSCRPASPPRPASTLGRTLQSHTHQRSYGLLSWCWGYSCIHPATAPCTGALFCALSVVHLPSRLSPTHAFCSVTSWFRRRFACSQC